MLTIYAIPVSLYCAKLRIVLRNKAAVWEERLPPGGYGSDIYKAVVPSGNLPALVDGDLLLADSEVIAEYLDERIPDPPMLPPKLAARAKARELSRFHDTRLEPELRKLFALFSPADRNPAISAAQSTALSARLVQLARMLPARDESTVDGPMLADCGFPISFVWIDALTPILGLTVTWPKEVLSYRERIEQHPAIADEVADYRIKLIDYLAQRTAP
jgi:glutathione S-transferase